MSKSTGNVIAPEEIINQYGAEILRLWVAATDYRDDIRLGQETLQRLSDAYRRIRNTARYILGNLKGFEPAQDSVGFDQMLELDRWALSRLTGLIARVEKAYQDYEFHVIYHAIHNFCAIDLSAFYLDILKDRIYTSAKSSLEYRSARTAIYLILDALTRMLAPVLSFTSDEIWAEIPGEREASVHLAAAPDNQGAWRDLALEERYEKLQKVRGAISKVLEVARSEKSIGQSLEARVLLVVPTELKSLLNDYLPLLPAYLIVSQVEICTELEGATPAEEIAGLFIKVELAQGEKCERCWNYVADVGQNDSHPQICGRCVAALAAG